MKRRNVGRRHGDSNAKEASAGHSDDEGSDVSTTAEGESGNCNREEATKSDRPFRGLERRECPKELRAGTCGAEFGYGASRRPARSANRSTAASTSSLRQNGPRRCSAFDVRMPASTSAVSGG